MRNLPRLTAALSLLLLLTPAPPLAAQAEEDEYAQTPTDLAELLGPEGLDGIDREYSLSCEGADQSITTRHVQIIRQADQIHFIDRSLLDAEFGQQYLSSTSVYTLEGNFIRHEDFLEIDTDDGRHVVTRTLEREDDLLVSYEIETGTGVFFELTTPEETIEKQYQPQDAAIPAAWLPLALAYHIRENNMDFIVPVCNNMNEGRFNIQHYRHAGDEAIEVLGQEAIARVWMTHFQSGDDDRFDSQGWDAVTQVYALPDGSTVRKVSEQNGVTRSDIAVIPEDAAEILERPEVEVVE